MFRIARNGLFCFNLIIFFIQKCSSDLLPPAPPSLALYAPNSAEYTEVLVRREHDNLTLICELRGDRKPHRYVWNYLSDSEGTQEPLRAEPQGLTLSSKLVKLGLRVSDSGQYICSAPPFSVTKYLLVQTKGPQQCARGAFWCGARCVLPTYVCDGHRDCLEGEDEAPQLCGSERPCVGPDKLNCSSGRCIPEAACCRGDVPLCRHPYCCDEHPKYSRHVEGFVDVEYPALFEDRHAPDDYGFIQSTIYTVTACALIFMIAVVLLVSAICKMHMKRAALRSYAQSRDHRQMFGVPRFPPCYEASRLLQQQARSPPHSAPGSPLRDQDACTTTSNTECPEHEQADNGESVDEARTGLSRLGAIFSNRYRQVPTQPSEVEMNDIRCSSLNSSPTRLPARTRLDNYRSPTYCDLNSTDFYFTSPDTADCGRDLNYMATPIEFFRRRTLSRNNPIDRILDQINVNTERPRPLTLQLGRFQLSIPRFGRRSSQELGRRPDTPNVAEINIDDLDFVRLNSNETYTLNGRTIRLLGANFENYPTVLTDNTVVRPPPYNEAMRYKLYGPPPEYLSRDTLNVEQPENNGNAVITGTNVDEEARTNVEMPPRYEDLASGVDRNANNNNGNVTSNDSTPIIIGSNATVIDGTGIGDNEICDNATAITGIGVVDNGNVDTLSAVMENLPAIDSDVNANDASTGTNNGNNVIDNGNFIVNNGNE